MKYTSRRPGERRDKHRMERMQFCSSHMFWSIALGELAGLINTLFDRWQNRTCTLVSVAGQALEDRFLHDLDPSQIRELFSTPPHTRSLLH